MIKMNKALKVALWIGFITIIGAAFYCLSLVRLQTSDKTVSGIVYNYQSGDMLTNNTYFSIRASENTVVTEENASKFCLPPNSPYAELVNEAAKNKNVKVVVTSSKVSKMASSPFQCIDNVKVERQK